MAQITFEKDGIVRKMFPNPQIDAFIRSGWEISANANGVVATKDGKTNKLYNTAQVNAYLREGYNLIVDGEIGTEIPMTSVFIDTVDPAAMNLESTLEFPIRITPFNSTNQKLKFGFYSRWTTVPLDENLVDASEYISYEYTDSGINGNNRHMITLKTTDVPIPKLTNNSDPGVFFGVSNEDGTLGYNIFVYEDGAKTIAPSSLETMNRTELKELADSLGVDYAKNATDETIRSKILEAVS